jgi:hypothetical protein
VEGEDRRPQVIGNAPAGGDDKDAAKQNPAGEGGAWIIVYPRTASARATRAKAIRCALTDADNAACVAHIGFRFKAVSRSSDPLWQNNLEEPLYCNNLSVFRVVRELTTDN